MPTVKKKFMASKQRTRNARELTERRYTNLTSEMDVIVNGDLFKTQEDRRLCYESNKSEILDRWLIDPKNYCTRPLCYHQFENRPPKQIVGQHKWFNSIDHHPGKWELSPIEEKEHEYLFRLGLLQPKETERYETLRQEAERERGQLVTLALFLPANTITTNNTKEVKGFL